MKPHIVFITETKTNEEQIIAQFVDCPEYVAIRRDRGSSHGGGVLLLVKNDIRVDEIHDNAWEGTESVVREIKHGRSTVKVACMYRPPNAESDYSEKVRDTIQKLGSSPQGQVLICGDFNFPQIDWSNNTVKGGETTEQSKFLDACQDVFLQQHVQHFTRVRGSDRPSLLDLILTKHSLEIENVQYAAPIGTSDHCVLKFDMLLEGSQDRQVGQPKKKLLQGKL